MTRASMLIQNPDPDGGEIKDLDSQANHDTKMASRNSSVKHRKGPVNKHTQSLQAFLIAHMENLTALQTAMSSGSEMHAKRSNGERLWVKCGNPVSMKWQVTLLDRHLVFMTRTDVLYIACL